MEVPRPGHLRSQHIGDPLGGELRQSTVIQHAGGVDHSGDSGPGRPQTLERAGNPLRVRDIDGIGHDLGTVLLRQRSETALNLGRGPTARPDRHSPRATVEEPAQRRLSECTGPTGQDRPARHRRRGRRHEHDLAHVLRPRHATEPGLRIR